MKTIIFVCVSNTCRSPMAEYLCRQHLEKEGLHGSTFIVKSRSLSTDYEPEGSPASEQGVTVMELDYNMDMRAHRSTLLTQKDVDEAFLIVPVKRDLGRFIESSFSDVADKIQFFINDIPDPWHQPVPVFRHCAQNINNMMPTIISVAKKRLQAEL